MTMESIEILALDKHKVTYQGKPKQHCPKLGRFNHNQHLAGRLSNRILRRKFKKILSNEEVFSYAQI
jgi:hypothetical protein